MTSSLPPPDAATPSRVLHMLFDLMHASDSDTARIQAAKILLERMAPQENDEAWQREEQERNDAIAEARCLLAELALAKSAGIYEPVALAENSAAPSDHPPDP